jgi:hypothetical protein
VVVERESPCILKPLRISWLAALETPLNVPMLLGDNPIAKQEKEKIVLKYFLFLFKLSTL